MWRGCTTAPASAPPSGWYDRPQQVFYLLVSRQLDVPDPTPAQQQRIVGVDVGQRYLAVATDTHNQTLFFPGKAVRARADHYARLRQALAAHRHSLPRHDAWSCAPGERDGSRTSAITSSAGALWTPIRTP
jgi:hypothetical protein